MPFIIDTIRVLFPRSAVFGAVFCSVFALVITVAAYSDVATIGLIAFTTAFSAGAGFTMGHLENGALGDLFAHDNEESR